jgi:hypothetical protein
MHLGHPGILGEKVNEPFELLGSAIILLPLHVVLRERELLFAVQNDLPGKG